MKTTKLMTAFALSAMFAACSQDAELNETIAKNDFSNIPVVEADFTVNAGVDSRMATKFGWEVGDKVGFAWLGGIGTGLDVDGTAWQNHPLFCTDATKAAFKTETMLYVGEYYAYMPYTAGNMKPENVVFAVTGQPLTTNSDELAKHAIYISPELTTLQKPKANGTVDEGNQKAGMGNNLPLNIARVSNAATINLTFANAASLTDLKVYSVALKAANLVKSFKYQPIESVDVENWNNAKDGSRTFTNAEYTCGEIVSSSKNGIAVVDNKLTVYMLTMGDGSVVEDMDVVVSTNYGDVTVNYAESVYGKYNDPCITFAEGTTAKTIKTTALFNNLGSAGTMNVYVDMKGKEVGNGVVKSQAELMDALNMLVISGYTDPVEYTIKPAQINRDKNYVFTDFTLPANLKAPITLKADAGLVNGFVFSGATVINKDFTLAANAEVEGTMTVELKKNSAGTAAVKMLTLAEGVTLTINNEAVLTNNGYIAGTGAIELVAYDNVNAKAAGKYVSNNALAKIGASVTNNGEIQWIAGTLPNCSGLAYAEVYDFATLTKASKAFEAATNASTVARFNEETTFANSGLDLNVFNSIQKIEINAPVTINVTKNTVTEAPTTITFSGLEEGETFIIKKNASLTIVSDLKDNKIVFGNGTDVTLKVNQNATLDLTKITFNGLASIKNDRGNVKTTNSNVNCTVVGSSNSDFN